MPEQLSPGLVVCLALILVVVINAGLVLALAGGGVRAQIRLVQRAVRSARDPWKAERQAAEELHRRIGVLRAGNAASGGSPSAERHALDPAGSRAAPAQTTPDRPTSEPPRAG